MSVVLTALLAVQILSALIMIGLILVQHGKGAEARVHARLHAALALVVAAPLLARHGLPALGRHAARARDRGQEARERHRLALEQQ